MASTKVGANHLVNKVISMAGTADVAARRRTWLNRLDFGASIRWPIGKSNRLVAWEVER
jgi:hypothetical protein